MDYSKLLGKEVECSRDGVEWFTGRLFSITGRRWTVFNVRVVGLGVAAFNYVREKRLYRDGDTVKIMGKSGVVKGYTKGGKLKVEVDGTEWCCEQSAVVKAESYFGGFIAVAESMVEPGTMVCINKMGNAVRCECPDAPLGFMVGIDMAVKEPVRKFKVGDVVTCVDGREPIGGVVRYDDNDVIVRLGHGCNFVDVALGEESLELYEEEPEEVRVEASSDMDDDEKLEKVQEFAEALGLDVIEALGDDMIIVRSAL